MIAAGAIKGFKDSGATRLELHSLPSAEDFYMKIGMVETGRQKNKMKEFYMGTQAYLEIFRFSKRFFKLTAVK